MATFKVSILIHHKRNDDKYPVSIRMTLNRKQVYLKTDYYVMENQLDEQFKIKDRIIAKLIDKKIEYYEDLIFKLGDTIGRYTADSLKDYLTAPPDPDEIIDFVAFANAYIAKKAPLQVKRARCYATTLNSLTDFYGHKTIPTTSLTYLVLEDYEKWLYKPRTLKRVVKGKIVTYQKPPCKSSGVREYMMNLKILFNAAIKHYNDDTIKIKNNPFLKYEMPIKKKTRHRDLDMPTIKSIIESDISVNGTHGNKRSDFGRDVFAMSFFLCGMNTVDLFKVDEYKKGRLTYKRSKTKERREDEALISIKVEPELIPYFEKYKDPTGTRVFKFYQMFKNEDNFQRSMNKGLAQICEELEINESVTSYFARHSWSTIARNDLGISKDDIHEALNHKDQDMKTTDIYIRKDWSAIDKANRKMLDFYKKSPTLADEAQKQKTTTSHT